ncbi:isoleucine--tRNA ligase [Synergistaceae bacterium OttesenSCG-928-D05]|nr:isoleucine--tRNA ligase [Synergistaceae bacterium OttesenSCG-928-D05]
MANDYKDTLFLPQTSFPMRANLSQREPEFLKFWYDIDLYGEQKKKNKGKPSFILHDGPPYANASIHIGTATNKVLKDFVVKYKFLRGYFAPYVPGYDTHGLPIELKVLKELNTSKEEISPVELRERCREYAEKYIAVQTGQFKRLGVIGDWDDPYITYKPAYEATQLEGFADMVDKGLVYKGRKAIYWCTDCETALAAAEIEYADETSPSIFVAYPYQDAAKAVPELKGKDVSIIIWTTTPWTLPASQAVSIHPRFDYGFYEADGKIYMIATGLKEEVEKVTGFTFGEPLAVRKGAELERTEATHPFYDKKVLVVLADYVTLDTGTGAVHTAPGHGAEDYETGVRYGLEVYNPVDPTGHYYSDTPIFAGKSLSDAEHMIFEILAESGRLLGRQKITHSYPHCWRCKKPVIFRATDQWFVAVADFRDEALKSIAEVQWVPEWGEDRITNMVRDRSDWCISRQRIWGVPIPAFYCEDCNEVILTGDRVRRVADVVRKLGTNCWWQLSPEELVGDLAVCPKCGGKHLRKDTDIMDVWFDSGASHAAVCKSGTWPDLHWPVDMYLEGSDQHRGWFQTSLLNSVATFGRAPYDIVLTHGFIMDGEGKKMSKSLGNVMTPEKIIDRHGADILRLWVASSDYRGDVRISQQIFDNLIESYRRIRNTARFLLANLKGFDPKKDVVPHMELSPLDQYIMLKLERLRSRATAGLDEYEFHQPMTLIHQFCDNELSSFYIDVSKDTLYADAENDHERRSIRSVMWESLKALTVMMAPVLSFTAEEIWQQMREMDPELPRSVLLADWPENLADGLEPENEPLWDSVLTARTGVLRALEAARSQGIIGHPLDADVLIVLGDLYQDLGGKITDELWEKILIVSSAKVVAKAEGANILFDDETTGLTVGVSKSAAEKCPRCWKRRPEVKDGSLCDRCKDVLGE